MRKLGKSILLIFTLGILVSFCFGGLVSAAETGGSMESGFTWKMDTATKTLTISGKGEMPIYVQYPFEQSYNQQIEHIVLNEGITSSGHIHLGDRTLTVGKSFSKVPDMSPISFTLHPDNPTFSLYEGALYSKDFTIFYTPPSTQEWLDVVKLHPNIKKYHSSAQPRERFELSDTNTTFSLYNGLLYSKDFKTLYSCPINIRTPNFHPNLEVIESGAILAESYDEPMVIPEGVHTLKVSAIYNFGLVVLPDSLKNLENTRTDYAVSGRETLYCSVRNTAVLKALPNVVAIPDTDFYAYYGKATLPVKENGWVKENGKWYCYYNGTLCRGWYIEDVANNKKHYLQIDSTMPPAGKNRTYLLDPRTGAMVTGFYFNDSIYKAHYFNSSGLMQHSKWQYANENWYYLNAYGAGVTKNWAASGGKWYYLEEDGTMATDKWIEWYKKWYYVGSDGAMYTNRKTPDGYTVNASGVRV